MPGRRVAATLILIAIAAYFLAFTRAGLTVSFHPDDTMNLHAAWADVSWPRLALANLTPFTPVYRPLGGLYYRAVYELAGFEPLPFRVVTYAFMLANIALVYFLAAALSSSRTTAAAAAFLWSFHGRFIDYVVNNGTVYDVLCTTCVLLALLCYIRERQTHEKLRPRIVAAVLLLYTAALNAKEMAASLPLVILAYESIFHWRGLRSFTRATPWLLVSVTIGALLIKTGSAGVFHGNAAYQPSFTLEQLSRTNGHFLDELFQLCGGIVTSGHILVLWLLLLAVAIAVRSKALLFAAAWIALAPLPVSFIPTRGFFVMYLPYVGWSLYLAALAAAAVDAAAARLPAPLVRLGVPAAVMAAILVTVVLAFQRSDKCRPALYEDHPLKANIRSTISDFRRTRPCPSRGGRVLFLDDRFPAESWDLLVTTRLYCHDPKIEVDRRKTMAEKSIDRSKYVLVLTYETGELTRLSAVLR